MGMKNFSYFEPEGSAAALALLAGGTDLAEKE
jgi:hypothetical protein